MFNQIVNQKPTAILKALLKGKNVRINGQLWHIDPLTYQMVDENGDVVSVDIHDFLVACWDMEAIDFNRLQTEDGVV